MDNNKFRYEGDGIEHTTVIEVLDARLAVRSCVGIALVVPFYDAGVGRSIYGNGGAKQKVSRLRQTQRAGSFNKRIHGKNH